MGCVGGGAWHLVKGLKTSPTGYRLKGALEVRACARLPGHVPGWQHWLQEQQGRQHSSATAATTTQINPVCRPPPFPQSLRKESPRLGGSFANWGLTFSMFDCSLQYLRKKVCGGSCGARAGVRSALACPTGTTHHELKGAAPMAALATAAACCPAAPRSLSCACLLLSTRTTQNVATHRRTPTTPSPRGRSRAASCSSALASSPRPSPLRLGGSCWWVRAVGRRPPGAPWQRSGCWGGALLGRVCSARVRRGAVGGCSAQRLRQGARRCRCTYAVAAAHTLRCLAARACACRAAPACGPAEPRTALAPVPCPPPSADPLHPPHPPPPLQAMIEGLGIFMTRMASPPPPGVPFQPPPGAPGAPGVPPPGPLPPLGMEGAGAWVWAGAARPEAWHPAGGGASDDDGSHMDCSHAA